MRQCRSIMYITFVYIIASTCSTNTPVFGI